MTKEQSPNSSNISNEGERPLTPEKFVKDNYGWLIDNGQASAMIEYHKYLQSTTSDKRIVELIEGSILPKDWPAGIEYVTAYNDALTELLNSLNKWKQ